jgi:carboxypeptidase T
VQGSLALGSDFFSASWWRRTLLLALFAAGALLLISLRPAAAADPLDEFPPLTPVTPPTLVVVRVTFTDEAMLNGLASVLDVWEVQHGATPGQGYLVALLSLAQAEALRNSGLQVELDAAKTAQLQQPVWVAGQTSGIPGYSCYRTVEETESALANLAAAQPELAEWVDIGDSWNQLHPGNGDGHDLHVLVLTNRAIAGPKPRFFLLAAIHARELTTAEIATRFAEELINGYGRDPDSTWLLDYTEIHILPIANPDGRKWAEQLLYWRKNTNRNDGCTNESPFFSYYGVDLNRNSSFKWGQCEGSNCSSSGACQDTFRGSAPASEPETQAIQEYVTSLFPDQRGPNDDDPAPADTEGLLISLHSYSELILFPWGWRSTPSPNHDQLQTLGRKFGYFTGYVVCQSGSPGCIYMTDGTTDDWAYGELGVAAYTFELGTAFFQQCSDFENQVLPETMPALHYAAKAAYRPYQLPAGPESSGVLVTPTRIISGSVVTLTAQLDDTRHRSNTGVEEPSQPISAARYSLAAPSWITGTTTYSMTAVDGAFDTPTESVQATVTTEDWPVGRQLLLVEGRDGAGNWGTPSGVFVEVLATAYGVAVAAEQPTAQVTAGAGYTATLVVTNTGLVSDTFTITASPTNWAVSSPETVGPLLATASATVTVPITVPAAVSIGASETLSFTITSQGDGTIQQTTSLTLQVTEPAVPAIFLPWVEAREQ